MKRLWILTMLLLLLGAPAQAEKESFVFGSSEMGRNLVCWQIGPDEAEISFLFTFAVHGFEGLFDRDGQVLVDTAECLIAHYEQEPESMQGFKLYVVPCVNPDGLIDGVAEKGFGRMNAKELDINRDFPVKWVKRGGKMNRTGDEPFATAEARALRDLVEQISPTYAVDVHGWLYGVYGPYEVARYFQKAFKFPIRDYGGGGLLSQWMNSVTQGAVLVELPGSPGREGFAQRSADDLAEALDLWMEDLRQEM